MPRRRTSPPTAARVERIARHPSRRWALTLLVTPVPPHTLANPNGVALHESRRQLVRRAIGSKNPTWTPAPPRHPRSQTDWFRVRRPVGQRKVYAMRSTGPRFRTQMRR